MQVNELKKSILTNTLSDDLLILVCNENHFLAKQYVEEIAKKKNIQLNKINCLADTVNSSLSLVFDYANELNILEVDEFNELSDDYDKYRNIIVICDKISKSIAANVEKYTVTLPKLQDWQIKDYIKVYCKGLDDDAADWLYFSTNGDIYRIINELDKINLFNLSEKKQILNNLRFDDYSDLYSQSIFNVVDAVVKKDKLVLLEYLKHKTITNIDGFALISLVLSKLKQILYVNFKSGLNIEQIGISPKQYNAIKYYYKDCSEKYLVNAIKFLSDIDKRVKSGELELNDLNSYLICHLLSF